MEATKLDYPGFPSKVPPSIRKLIDETRIKEGEEPYKWDLVGEELPNPSLKEEDILALGWEPTPDTTDYYLGKSYIKTGSQDICWYELRNDDADNIWAIQECDEEGNYVQEGENMFFILKNRKDLKDLMRLMGLK
jgi:hypothetical protein